MGKKERYVSIEIRGNCFLTDSELLDLASELDDVANIHGLDGHVDVGVDIDKRVKFLDYYELDT